ncbi:MAG: ABC transporter permease [Candidatus Raskinella chloraquaticus]|uniref:ABC transporter permease n=1 Tax=Candidatus Raskinella chloraquaticus TaxID=1951219 RepID=A0A1W9HZ02_9HYPH|nr:MAG: ABC transporter permease [Proteobacteria bacterium SG_bin8]
MVKDADGRSVFGDWWLWLLALPILVWTLLPIYNLLVIALSNEKEYLSGRLWPSEPTLQNFKIALTQQHYYLRDFWRQLGNSFFIAASTGIITLFIATSAAFAISRLRLAGGRYVMLMALATYLIPAAFLAVPMYKGMGNLGLLDTHLALILAMVALASPYAIWVLKQAADKLPRELDEAALVDGATPLQIFRLIFVPLMAPSLVAIGVYALLLAWNEYLYAFLLLSAEKDVPLAVALGLFLGADDSPWNLMMATGLIYALPPVAIYYLFRRYMVAGLTSGAVKS